MIALALALLLAAPAAGMGVATHLKAPARLTVGDRFRLELVVTAPRLAIVTGPVPDSTGVFAVADDQRKTRLLPDRAVTTYRLDMAAFQPGRHVVPAFRFLVTRGDQADTLRSDTVAVTVASTLPAKMEDIHGLAPPETFPNWMLWILVATAILVAIALWIVARLYRRLREGLVPARPLLPPWEEAFEALDALPWREWLESGQVKRYYYALSEILKRYIERRFQFDAVEQTTTEMLASMRAHKTPMRDDVARFFTRSDLVKYSKLVPPADEAESAIGWVREFVTKTRPVEPAPAPASSNAPAAAAGSA